MSPVTTCSTTDHRPQLAPCRMVVCGSPNYFEKHGKPRTPADLTAHNCLTVAGTGLFYYREWHLMAADGTTLNISPMGNLRNNTDAATAIAGQRFRWTLQRGAGKQFSSPTAYPAINWTSGPPGSGSLTTASANAGGDANASAAPPAVSRKRRRGKKGREGSDRAMAVPPAGGSEGMPRRRLAQCAFAGHARGA